MLSSQQYDIVTAFEVIEHVPDQSNLFTRLKSVCSDNGIIIFSTLIKEPALTHDWWYASPRNGHVSFHSTRSLHLLCQKNALHLTSLSDEIHVASGTPETLDATRNWPVIAINDAPQFRYAVDWTVLEPL